MKYVKTERDEIEAAICAALDDVASSDDIRTLHTPQWTHRVKDVLASLGKRRDYHVYANQCMGADGGEFLVDLCWLEYETSALVGMRLAVESEWWAKAVDDDFQKLIALRADHKLMIYTVSPNADHDKPYEYLMRHFAANAHAQPGDRYLLSCWLNHDDGFRHDAFVLTDSK